MTTENDVIRVENPQETPNAGLPEAGSLIIASRPDDAGNSPLQRAVAAAQSPATSTRAVLETWWNNLSANTKASYDSGLNSFARFCETDRATAMHTLLTLGCGPATGLVGDFAKSLTALGRSPYTVRLYVAALQSLVARANELGAIHWSLRRPIKDRGGMIRSVPRRRGLPDSDWRLLLAAVAAGNHPARDLAVLLFVRATGLRRSEVWGIRREQVQGEPFSVELRAKGGVVRSLICPAAIWSAVSAWLVERGDAPGPLWGWASAKAMSQYFADVAGKAGITRFGLHRLRRTFGTSVSMEHGLEMARAALGHAETSTTRIYDESEQALVQKLIEEQGRAAIG